MKRFCFLLLLAFTTPWLAGCNKSPAVPPVAAAALTPSLPTEAQPKLPTIKLWIGTKEMTTELALTEIQERTGMMFRTNMAPNDGMLFVYGAPQQVGFWMMNCTLPLTAAYIGSDGTILEIHDLEPHNTNTVFSQSAAVQYVLEAPRDWFKSNNMPVGTAISTEKGTLRETFFSRRQ